MLEDALLNVIANPDARHELRRIADEPGVGVVVCGAGLAGRRDREPRLPHGAERGAAADHVFHHVDHQPGVLGVHHLLAPRVGFPEDVPLAVLDAEDADRLCARAERGEGRIGRDHLHRLHTPGADVDRGIGRERGGDAVAARLADHGLLAQRHAELDRGEVAR